MHATLRDVPGLSAGSIRRTRYNERPTFSIVYYSECTEAQDDVLTDIVAQTFR